jgi:hypothetical protein
VLGVVTVRVSADRRLRSVDRDGTGLQGSVVLGLGHGVDNLLYLGSARRGVLPGVVSRRVDVGELALNCVVVLTVLVHISGNTDVGGSGEAIALVIPRWTSNNGSISLGSRSVSTATKSDSTSTRAIVVVLHRCKLVLQCSVRLIVGRVGRAVVGRVVRLRVVRNVGLLVVHVVRLGVRLVVRLRVRLIVRLAVRRVVRLGVRLKVGLMVRLKVTRSAVARSAVARRAKVTRSAVARRAKVLRAAEGRKAPGVRLGVDILML